MGALPGIPGTHAPGNYLVDYEARTIRPVSIEESNEDPNGTTEPLPDPSKNLAKEKVDESSTAEPEPSAPTEPTQTPNIVEEVAHIEDELQSISAEQQQ